MADPVTAILLAVGASAGTAATVGTVITVASTAFTLYSAFQTQKLPDGPRLGDLSIQTSTYGTPIPKVYGTDIVKGNVIWMRDNQIQENFKTKKVGKKAKQEIAIYSATYALALGEGIVTKINRIWIDGKLAYKGENEGNQFKIEQAIYRDKKGKYRPAQKLNDVIIPAGDPEGLINDFSFDLRRGDYDQLPHPVIQSFTPDVSGFRGTAYLFFDRLNLERYGNRIPDMTIELFRETPVGEEPDTEEFALEPLYVADEQSNIGYSTSRFYLNDTFLPKRKALGVSVPTAASYYLLGTRTGVSPNEQAFACLKNVGGEGIQYTVYTPVLGIPFSGASVDQAATLTDTLYVAYKDSSNPGVVHLNQRGGYIVDYFASIPRNDITSTSSQSPVTLASKPRLVSPKIYKIYPWDFPFAYDETLKLFNPQGVSLPTNPQRFIWTIPVINNTDLHIVIYNVQGSGNASTPHIGLLKTINNRCVVKRLTGLAATLLPTYPVFLNNSNQDCARRWAAIELNGKIFIYNSFGYYRPRSDGISGTLVEYQQFNFPGFVSFNVPSEWADINYGQSTPSIQSFLTTIRTANGFYVSKVGLNALTQITDWEYTTTFSPKAFLYDPASEKTLIINETTGTPTISTAEQYLDGLQLCSLTSDFFAIDETFTFDFFTERLSSSANGDPNSGYSRFEDEKIYTYIFNKSVILDRTDFSSSSTLISGTFETNDYFPTQQIVYEADGKIVIAEGNYDVGRTVTDEIHLRLVAFYFNRKTNPISDNGVITLAEIIETESISTGYLTTNDIDTSDAAGTIVQGITFSRQGSVAANLQSLAEAYFYYLMEEDYKIKVKMRGNLTSQLTITDDFLNAREVGQTGFLLKNTRPSSYKMPAIFEATYRDPALMYEVNTQSIERAGYDEPTKQNIELPMVLNGSVAKEIVNRIIKQVYIQAQGEWELTVPAMYSHLEAGHLITVDSDTYGTYSLLIKSIDKGRPGIVKIVGVKEDPSIYVNTVERDFEDVAFDEKGRIKPKVSFVVIDSLPFDAAQDGIGFWVAAWDDLGRDTGYGLIQSQNNFLTYENLTNFAIPGGAEAFLGVNTLPATELFGLYNAAATLNLTALGTAQNFPSVDVANAYTAFYGDENRWEIIRFTDVTDTGEGIFTIGNILRGYKGTQAYAGTHQIGDYLVIIDNNLSKVTYDEESLGVAYQYKIVVPGEKNQDAWPTFSKTLSGFGREPLPVTQVTGSRNNAQDLTISWIPQVRYNIQYKDRIETLSDETILSYTVSILDSSDNIVRSVTVQNANTFIYTATMQLSDFGSLQTTIKVGITKDSQVMGTGLLTVVTL